MKKLIVFFAFIGLLSGCTAPFKITETDSETGRFSTGGRVSEKELLIYKIFSNLDKSQYVYLRTDSKINQQGFENYMIESLKRIGFVNIYNEEQLASYVLGKGLSDKVPSISDLLALNRLAKSDGQFLYIDSEVNNSGGCCWFKFDLNIYDPLTGEKLLAISRSEVNDLDFDREVLYPVINKIKDWRDSSLSAK